MLTRSLLFLFGVLIVAFILLGGQTSDSFKTPFRIHRRRLLPFGTTTDMKPLLLMDDTQATIISGKKKNSGDSGNKNDVCYTGMASSSTKNMLAGQKGAAPLSPPAAGDGTSNTRYTLAGPYLIQCSSLLSSLTERGDYMDDDTTTMYQWSCIPVDNLDLDRTEFPSSGAQSWAALLLWTQPQPSQELPLSTSTSLILTAQLHTNTETNHSRLVISCTTTPSSGKFDNGSTEPIMDDRNDDESSLIVAVLSRVMAQWVISENFTAKEDDDLIAAPTSTTIELPNKEEERLIVVVESDDLQKLIAPVTHRWNDDNNSGTTTTDSNNFIRKLFADIEGPQSSSEIVEMVDRNGQTLGCVPRHLVHQLNLLHRGIGMFVTRDKPIILSGHRTTKQQQQPDLYCHQRTASKRIFPSLYDMFVGGVSLAGEDSTETARREVSEELGLQAALEGIEERQPCPKLSDCLLRCVVCTGYNRCVVDLFSYTMDTSRENVKWQEEEVARGCFVPYGIVEAAADRSILRLCEENAWPGRYPPIQSHRKGEIIDTTVDADEDLGDWRTFDFVPDGLLVWEAWLRQIQGVH